MAGFIRAYFKCGEEYAKSIVGKPPDHIFNLNIFELDPSSILLKGDAGLVTDDGRTTMGASMLFEVLNCEDNSPDKPIMVDGKPRPGRSDVEDSSYALCARLLHLPVALPPVDNLRALLLGVPAAKFPLSSPNLNNIHDPNLAAHFTTFAEQPARSFYTMLEYSLLTHLLFHGEQLAAQAVDQLFTRVLLVMDSLAPDLQRLGLQLYRDAGDSDSLATLLSATGRSLQPDCQLKAGDGVRLIYKGEEKMTGAALKEAAADLQKKTQVWTPLYYGNLPYLLCHAAAGSSFQLYAIPKDTMIPVPISSVLDMYSVQDRLRMFLLAVQLYRLLAAATALLPLNVLPVDQLLTHEHPDLGFTRTLIYKAARATVVKTVRPFSKYASAAGVDFASLQQLYEATKGAVGVVHAVEGPLLKEDCYKVELSPVGRNQEDAIPVMGDQLRTAALGLLQGLEAIHKAGFCHRDVRWPNVACTYDRRQYFWLDLEMAAPLDAEAAVLSQLTGWPEGVLVEGKYTAASDLHRLGCLFDEPRFSMLDVSAAGLELLGCLRRPAAQQLCNASELLGHKWFTG